MDKSKNNINKNLTMAVMFMSGTNFVTFLILLWVYSVTNEIWFLIASIAMLIAGIAFMILVSKYRAKINKLNQLQKNRNSESNEPS